MAGSVAVRPRSAVDVIDGDGPDRVGRPDLVPAGRRLSQRPPAWPVTALLIGYPLWWGLGLADFMWMILALPMICQMVAWQSAGGRRLRVPPGFGLWLLLLIIGAAGIATISLPAPGTVISPVSHRILSYINRVGSYGGLTVVLLYTGNLTEEELPRRKLAWMLGLVGVYAVAGGVAGMIMPHVQFASPLLHVLPQNVQANPYIQATMNPGLSQVQTVLGSAAGRP